MHALEITNLHKAYGKTVAVDNLNLTVKKGEFFGLLGNNGAGKSTTINCVTGITQFTTGSISVMGHDVKKDYQQARASIGLSPQEFNVDIFARIDKVLHFVGGYYGMSRTQREKRIDELFTQFGLHEHREKKFGQLSGGLKRRMILARALMHDPDVLILDEPTAGVDVGQRHDLWKYLQEMHRAGKTIILTSHYLEEVEKLCSRVAVLHNGTLIADMQKEEFAGKGTLEATYLSLTKGV